MPIHNSLNSGLQYIQLHKIAFLLYKTSKFLQVHKSKSFNYISPLELIQIWKFHQYNK